MWSSISLSLVNNSAIVKSDFDWVGLERSRTHSQIQRRDHSADQAAQPTDPDQIHPAERDVPASHHTGDRLSPLFLPLPTPSLFAQPFSLRLLVQPPILARGERWRWGAGPRGDPGGGLLLCSNLRGDLYGCCFAKRSLGSAGPREECWECSRPFLFEERTFPLLQGGLLQSGEGTELLRLLRML